MQIYGNKSKEIFYKRRVQLPQDFVRNTNMAAVPSCEYALYDYRRFVMDVKITQVGIGWNTPIPLPLVLQFRYRSLP